jgi:hypothetical protein
VKLRITGFLAFIPSSGNLNTRKHDVSETGSVPPGALPITTELLPSSSSSYIATDGQSRSSSWYRAPFGTDDQIINFSE